MDTEEVPDVAQEHIEPEFPQLTPISVTDVPLAFRTEWKIQMLADKEFISDTTVVGPSKFYKDSKYPFTVNLTTPDNITIIFKINVKSKIVGGEPVSQFMTFYIPRKTWKREIIKKNKKKDVQKS